MRIFRSTPSLRRGFSLVELLLVMTVIVILIAVAGPALRGLLGSDNRKAAVSQLMGALEQARATALEKGVNVFVGFAASDFPDPSWRFNRFLIFREYSDALDGPAGGNRPLYLALTKWQSLPQGMVLGNPADLTTPPQIGDSLSLTGNHGLPPAVDSTGNVSTYSNLEVVSFNSAGVIQKPAAATELQNGIYPIQGFYRADGRNQVETRKRQPGTDLAYDRIQLARYTGRARLTSKSFRR